ncbi:hypothetical protein [Paenibacillus roseipurpureus]|uniref:Uncharacterized protein n=1 Tax=Paenibacillus roseopurpureus TaxID=2918901 RepID=A0AA96LMC6_9BACL|nr:hypothetical protein [Paenibacillus sp. MBLB1832]WNR43658.1 hypothetical protein MJB10_21535 [Paenibacillus sp. MBLB1832]
MSSSKKWRTSYNIVFTLRAIRPSVRQRDFEEVNSGGPPARLTAQAQLVTS